MSPEHRVATCRQVSAAALDSCCCSSSASCALRWRSWSKSSWQTKSKRSKRIMKHEYIIRKWIILNNTQHTQTVSCRMCRHIKNQKHSIALTCINWRKTLTEDQFENQAVLPWNGTMDWKNFQTHILLFTYVGVQLQREWVKWLRRNLFKLRPTIDEQIFLCDSPCPNGTVIGVFYFDSNGTTGPSSMVPW